MAKGNNEDKLAGTAFTLFERASEYVDAYNNCKRAPVVDGKIVRGYYPEIKINTRVVAACPHGGHGDREGGKACAVRLATKKGVNGHHIFYNKQDPVDALVAAQIGLWDTAIADREANKEVPNEGKGV